MVKTGVSILQDNCPSGPHYIDGPSLHGDAFYERGLEDGVYLQVLDEGDASVLIYDLRLLSHFNLRGQSEIEDEFPVISFIDQSLKLSSKVVTVYCEVTIP